MKKITNYFKNTLKVGFLILTALIVNTAAATFTVTNANDSGAGSLRDAMTQANANGEADTINFDAAFFNQPRTITLTSGELLVTRDGTVGNGVPGRLLTINGPGADILTISGNNASRIFYVSTHGNLAMSGITVRDGNGVGTVLGSEGVSGGGMIAHDAFVSLSNVTFRNNAVPGRGGAIYLNGIRNFTMTGSLVTENFAVIYGGGIYAPLTIGTVTIRNTTISNNSTNNQVGGLATTGGTTMIENCLITGNRAGLASGGTNQIGGMALIQTTATVTDTTISNNTAGRANPNEGGNYGGVYADATTLSMTFRRINVSGNTVYTCCGGGGGGMYLRAAGGGSITLIDSTVSGNQALPGPATNDIYGGGIYIPPILGRISVINTTIANNVAGNAGGGIFNASSDLRVINSTITGNTVSGGGSSSGHRGGGGIFNA